MINYLQHKLQWHVNIILILKFNGEQEDCWIRCIAQPEFLSPGRPKLRSPQTRKPSVWAVRFRKVEVESLAKRKTGMGKNKKSKDGGEAGSQSEYSSATVFVSNLPYSFTNSQVLFFFSGFSVWRPRNLRGKSKIIKLSIQCIIFCI